MTRSQIVALLLGSCCVILVAGFAWRAYAPDEETPEIAPVSSETPRQSSTSDTPKAPQAAKAARDRTADPAAPPAAKTASLPPAPPPKTAKTATPSKTSETLAALAPASPRPGLDKANPSAVAPRQPQQQAAVVPPQMAGKAATSRPAFDVVRIEPSGEAVVAGRSRAATKIQLVAGDKVVAEALTDGSGHFVVTPTLPPGNYELTLRDGEVASLQSVTVSVAHKRGEKAVAVLAEPGKPTVVLTAPPGAGGKGSLGFLTAEVGKKAFYATGSAKPNAHLRLYADEKALADVTAGADGRWSLRLGERLAAGHHQLRADSVDAAGQVVARAEIPFDAPAEIADGKIEMALSQPDQSAAETARIGNTVVQRGDNLWRISRKLLGAGLRYTQIYDANVGQIRNPNLIYPGQVFVVPRSER